MPEKKHAGMVIYPDHSKLLLELSDQKAGQIIKAIVVYANTGALPEKLTGVPLYCFNTLRDDIERNWEKHEKKCEKNRQCIQARWEKEAATKQAVSVSDTDEHVRIQTNTNEYDDICTNTDEHERIPPNTNVYDRIRTNTNKNINTSKNMNTNTNTSTIPSKITDAWPSLKGRSSSSVLSYLLTGEDGEPIVIHGKS